MMTTLDKPVAQAGVKRDRKVVLSMHPGGRLFEFSDFVAVVDVGVEDR